MFNRSNRFHKSNGSRSRTSRFGDNRGARKPSTIDVNKFINTVQAGEETKYEIKNKFTDFNLDSRLLDNVLKKGYSVPLPIQDGAIPNIMAGKDLIGLANTGMGKTAAFLIPLIQKIILDSNQRVLIIAPTRELAEQIDEEFKLLARGLNQYSVLAIGGMGINSQMRDLRGYYNFLIGTPGRLKDLYERRCINYIKFNNLVLDEVDRMFDMGFTREITSICQQLPHERQSLFFSATIDSKVKNTIDKNSINPVMIEVKTRDTSANVDQNIIKISGTDTKIGVLHDILIKEDAKKVLIFGRTKYGVKRLATDLSERGFKADSIHGNKTQQQRKRVLAAFKMGQINILVATDVAARGLDIPNVSHVINFDIPETYDDYVHRIGRTGRANNLGKALTFV
jgi:superfamily II DNA/RNA helicase